ncbi:MAG: ribonuclease P protein component [Chloroflexota bacterium]|nr:ribonuclease P protein component [Chloroflexota bacterium]
MAKDERLRKTADFAEVYRRGKARACELVVLKVLPNGLERNRYGFVTSKRVGNAVVRNRVKRLLREVTRTVPAERGWDMVFIARERAAAADYHQMAEAVRGLMRRAHVLAGEGEDKGVGKTQG